MAFRARVSLTALTTLTVAAVLAITGCSTAPDAPDESATPSTSSVTSPSTDASASSAATSHRDPSSVHVLVNKQHPLTPQDWVPPDLQNLQTLGLPTTKDDLQLRNESAQAAQALFDAADEDDIQLSVVSAYRSYDYQVGTYQHWVNQQGKAAADQVSARPGYSEHQTGLAMDVVGSDGACTLQVCFEDTEAGRWVAEHAVTHGWVLRYPKDAEATTGYSYEPWHLRYVGVEAATQIMDDGGLVEESWGFPAAPQY